jgi:ribokinase
MVHNVVACLVLFQLGNDSFGQDFLCVLKNNKINTDHVHITNGVSSGLAQITVAENGERQLGYL